ncbi:hypothetical protein AAE478_004818 [Parahypoxylon ruwenzoriense]
MPYFRGVEISIVAGPKATTLTEYPHPDGSSVHLERVGSGFNEPRNRGQTNPGPSPSPSGSDHDPTRHKKVNPRDRFWLRYIVNQSSLPSTFIFFKMFVNGHHTVSWGIDTNTCSGGSVSRSLYEPSDGHKDRSDDPHSPAIVGIETRSFHFVPGLSEKTAAEDGGFIEVQVFRCRARKRIAPILNQYPHRHPERYGISSPRGGLMDNPQDATFYQYHLEDPRDSPYATFFFHYRSVKHLEQLNLIPRHETRRHQLASMNSGSASVPNPPQILAGVASPSAHQLALVAKSLDTDMFDSDIKNGGVAVSELSKASGLEKYHLKSSPGPSLTRPANMVSENTKKTQRYEAVAELFQRPLPELPKAPSNQASKESLRSSCPSLTPSLKQYVDSGAFEKEEVVLGTAQAILIPSESMQAIEVSNANTYDQEDGSFSDYAASSTSSEVSGSPALPSPEGYIATTGSVLERHLDQFDSPIAQSSPKRKTKIPPSKPESVFADDTQLPEPGTLKLSESEWLRRTPSPLRRMTKRIERLWNPRQENHPNHSSMVELPSLNEDAVSDAERPGNQIAVRDGLARNSTTNVDDVPLGNWI